MPVTLINGHVLLPHPADWSTSPAWKRTWQTGIVSALTGAEQRQGLRALPRIELNWVISALSLEERAMLDQRLDAAAQTGLVCAPFWGRGAPVTIVNPSAVRFGSAAWTWSINDWLFMQVPTPASAAYQNYEARQIVNGIERGGVVTFGLNAPLALQYPANPIAWPLLFGKFTAEKMDAITSWHGDARVTLMQLSALDQPFVGDGPTQPGDGIGVWKVGSTLVVS
jgi:hypothetical protein